jgi:hypothetical protein
MKFTSTMAAAELVVARVFSAHLLAAQLVSDNQPPSGGTLPREVTLSSPEIIMSLAILAMGSIVMLIVYLLARTSKLSSDGILKVTAVPLIVIAAVFLVTAGYSTNQLASVIGLMGTIAGYLLGARQPPSRTGGTDEK